MTDEQNLKALECCACMHKGGCNDCPMVWKKDKVYSCCVEVSKQSLDYINRLNSAKHLAETQLKELLSALYQRTDSEQGFTLYRKDIVELAKDYGIKEEELKWTRLSTVNH